MGSQCPLYDFCPASARTFTPLEPHRGVSRASVALTHTLRVEGLSPSAGGADGEAAQRYCPQPCSDKEGRGGCCTYLLPALPRVSLPRVLQGRNWLPQEGTKQQPSWQVRFIEHGANPKAAGPDFSRTHPGPSGGQATNPRVRRSPCPSHPGVCSSSLSVLRELEGPAGLKSTSVSYRWAVSGLCPIHTPRDVPRREEGGQRVESLRGVPPSPGSSRSHQEDPQHPQKGLGQGLQERSTARAWLKSFLLVSARIPAAMGTSCFKWAAQHWEHFNLESSKVLVLPILEAVRGGYSMCWMHILEPAGTDARS
ncbi:uncharacterized protein LOC126643989 isoform X1 [Myiozetetes cayanensis]|uniref:uncharacterized protein LOC126643989 isoform X1 n=1 Tax=Myiozetetes cayanensis TaxID=478635 RepID=UPI00215F63D8|nr:uncharacterized protein LOC126643989 isoform X1 [Myiozetetes cayanensis]